MRWPVGRCRYCRQIIVRERGGWYSLRRLASHDNAGPGCNGRDYPHWPDR